MSHALSPSPISTVSRRSRLGVPHVSQQPERALTHLGSRARTSRDLLARYTDRQGRPREVVIRRGLAGSTLVVDRDAVSLVDCLLVAHLHADEPAENAALICRSYLEDMRARDFRCRRLTEHDAHSAPLVEEADPGSAVAALDGVEPVDSHGCSYRLELVSMGMSIPALRWCQRDPRRTSDRPQPFSLRETIARIEDYEPMLTLTRRVLTVHRDDAEVSTSVLGAELTRVQESPIVLNRRLREVVLSSLSRQDLSMSEIAIRCGRIKRDCKGKESGETSWLARRLGLLPESGQSTPTPWIHSDVLGMIARRGLGISPREVELP
jgi:hypothetical protein